MPPYKDENEKKKADQIRKDKLESAVSKLTSELQVPLNEAKLNLEEATQKEISKMKSYSAEVRSLEEKLEQMIEALEKNGVHDNLLGLMKASYPRHGVRSQP